MIPSAMVDWDNTPRKQTSGWCYTGADPEKFKNISGVLLKKQGRSIEPTKIFILPWNEWAEGGYLEPDEKYGFRIFRGNKRCVDRE